MHTKLSSNELAKLEKIAHEIRISILKMVFIQIQFIRLKKTAKVKFYGIKR